MAPQWISSVFKCFHACVSKLKKKLIPVAEFKRRTSLFWAGWVLVNAVLLYSLGSHLLDPTLPWRSLLNQHSKEALKLLALIVLLVLGWVLTLVLICIGTKQEEGPLLRYKLGKKLGSGAYGSVYRATKNITDEFGSNERTFALKFIEIHNIDQANDAIGEATRLACIDHRSVVSVHEQFLDKMSVHGSSLVFFSVSPYRLCIALELCNGDLETEISHWYKPADKAEKGKDHKSQKRPPWPQLLRIFQEVVEGVEALHDKNIIHCDLKPANIFISADHKHVKIGDLGLAKTVHRRAVITQGLTFGGTPGYIAPEVWHDEAFRTGYSTSADNWSLGCIMMDIAYPTEVGGWAIAYILEEAGYDTGTEHQDDLAFFLADTREGRPPEAEVLAVISKHSCLNDPIHCDCPVVQKVVEHCLVVDPKLRWGCMEALQAIRVLKRAPSMCIQHSVSEGSILSMINETETDDE